MALQTCSHYMRQSRMPCLWATAPPHSRGKKPPPRPVTRERNAAKAPAGHDTGLGCFKRILPSFPPPSLPPGVSGARASINSAASCGDRFFPPVLPKPALQSWSAAGSPSFS